MEHVKHNSPLAEAYARSLLELAGDQAEQIGAELDQLRDVLRDVPNFQAFLADPSIGTVERAESLKQIFQGKVSPLLFNFLRVVNDKGRLGILPQFIDAYDDLLDEQLGKIEVDVTVAQRLAPDQLEAVRQRVGQVLKKDAVIHQYVDESIIGGMVLRVQDKLIDASVKAQLDAMKHQLLAARPK